MDQRSEIREFLSTRRAKITPEQAELPIMGGHRRVPGLRREEVALLAGISVEYYARLERGNLRGASDAVLDAVARALRLDEAEHAHLRDLARTAPPGAGRRVPRRSRPQPLRPTLQHLLDAMTEALAFIRNGRLDVLAINRLGRALYSPALTGSARPANRSALVLRVSPLAAAQEHGVEAGGAGGRASTAAGNVPLRPSNG